ncbi:DUF1566 domain-containing protein [uncultured Desulfuromusa sp.]|uniref:Lcl domain-containing protein n=1 Tax=uncultured Desulfuromusa sp. TaxID=219183 RepID=UPI002AA7E4BF|nr:DUF1566 domain-containing protein [uncultured Desulfuromusa sp.]
MQKTWIRFLAIVAVVLLPLGMFGCCVFDDDDDDNSRPSIDELLPGLEVSVDALSFAPEVTELEVTLTNSGEVDLAWDLTDAPAWLDISEETGQLDVGSSLTLTISVNRAGLADNTYTGDLIIDTDYEGVTATIPITMIVLSNSVATLPLLKTGLTESYDEDGVLDSEIRDDGYWQAGLDFSYTDNEDGTITDNVTGLNWMQSNSIDEFTYADAEDYCSTLTVDEGGWRIPNIYEYYTIFNFSEENPAINHDWFDGSSGYYWTSTSTYDWSGQVWTVREPYADDDPFDSVTGSNYVRCVKGDSLEPPATDRFVDNGSDTVLDKWTGLVWEAASHHNGETGYTWEEAITYCENKTTAGLEWHLPNVKQIQSLMAKDAAEPAINTDFFTNDSYTLWSSSTDAYTNGGTMELAWAVSVGGYGDFVLAGIFKDSNSDDGSNPMGARCVSWPTEE